MEKHTHRFVEEYDGLVGFGLDRETDEFALTYYLQKFSDDGFISLIRERMTDDEIESLFNTLAGLLKKHLTEEEYHRCFLKDKEG
ncbi:MAG: cytoplasmic protein [Deltaproteobacteria bacterium]|nr:cytoplasmic protein [Deltaproteobacteria bacterium]